MLWVARVLNTFTYSMLGEDRKRLSKRHAIDLTSYKEEGYLLMYFKYVMKLDGQYNRGHLTVEELIKIFEVQDIQKAGAV